MASLRSHLYFFIFFASLSVPSSSTQSNSWSQKNQVALFIFGDSLFDAGNNNDINNATGRANFWPYGETFFKYPTGRFSDGRIIPDFIAEYLNLPFISPYLQPSNDQYTNGVNFASAGAGALVETYPGMVINLKTQLSYFKNVEKQLNQELGDKETKKLLSKATYLIGIGSNDYISAFATNSTLLQHSKEYVGMVIGNLTIVLKEIYRNGGRKFGVVSLGSLGCIPALRAINKQINNSGGCMEEVTVLAKSHNKALSKALEKLEKELKGFKYSYFDFYTSTNDRANNPSKYGFKEGKEACCGSGPYKGILSCGRNAAIKEYELCENPSEYLFFDSSHPTEKFNNQLAKLMWSGNPDITIPCNLKELCEA
ncbi:zinc finger protein, putative [Ricinus communis]|uniref:Zinc finger protein, putative n=2 Tax=Ricinus communis TaxID=3988 RepID=B9T4S5_RICCO|nr:zinc finger protein, putative [Ricinus communis]